MNCGGKPKQKPALGGDTNSVHMMHVSIEWEGMDELALVQWLEVNVGLEGMAFLVAKGLISLLKAPAAAAKVAAPIQKLWVLKLRLVTCLGKQPSQVVAA